MSCGAVDLKAYVLGEATPAEKRSAEAHVGACEPCQMELERLGFTRTALLAIREEEPPRRIAFVSDPVFEPSGWRLLWQRLNPVALLASAALAGVIAFAVVRTELPEASTPTLQEAILEKGNPVPSTASSNTGELQKQIDQEVARRLNAAVQEAVNASEARQQARAAQMVKAVEDRLTLENREQMLIMEASVEMLSKRMNSYYRAAADFGGAE